MAATSKLNSIGDIRHYFAQNTVPYYFISASNFNLMGMHQWVKGWKHVNLLDCYDGSHPDVLVVPDNHAQVFQSIEAINAWLLASEPLRALVASRKVEGRNGRAIFLFFDEYLEQVCASLGLEV